MKSYTYLITMLFIAIFSMSCSSDPEVEVPKEKPTLSVSPTQFANVPASGGRAEISITSNQSSFEAVADKDWCKLTLEGTTANFSIVVSANTTGSARNAAVTVTAGKATPVKIAVSQLGETKPQLSVSPTEVTNVAASGGNTKITVTTNQSSWSVTSDNTWCKVTGKTEKDFTIAVDANSATSTRSATVTVSAGDATAVKITVSQLGKATPVLSVSPTEVTNVAASGGNTKITVTTNQASWSATSDNTWCKVTGKTEKDFTITVDANSTTSARSATVTVSAGDAAPIMISVSQLGTGPQLSVSPTQVTNVAASGGNSKITVTTNQASWSATSDNTWCKVTGKTEKEFTITVDANTTFATRSAVVTVLAGDATPVKISVSQLGLTPQLSVSPTQVTNVVASGGNSKITVTTNQSSWSATSDNAWCKVTGKTDKDFTITVDANSATSTRSATVTVSAGDATPVKISVSQLGLTPQLSVSPTQVTNVAAMGGNTKITVTTNQSSWSATSDNAWCKVTGKTDKDFTITVDANSATSARSATITVSAGSATPVKITVSQLGAAPSLSISPAVYTVVFSAASQSEEFVYNVTTNLSSWDVKVTTTETAWCKVSKDVANNRFTITADPNDSTTPRGGAIVTISAGSATPLKITVNQKSKSTQNSEDFGYGEGKEWD